MKKVICKLFGCTPKIKIDSLEIKIDCKRCGFPIAIGVRNTKFFEEKGYSFLVNKDFKD